MISSFLNLHAGYIFHLLLSRSMLSAFSPSALWLYTIGLKELAVLSFWLGLAKRVHSWRSLGRRKERGEYLLPSFPYPSPTGTVPVEMIPFWYQLSCTSLRASSTLLTPLKTVSPYCPLKDLSLYYSIWVCFHLLPGLWLIQDESFQVVSVTVTLQGLFFAQWLYFSL